jgi:hypothetical protein
MSGSSPPSKVGGRYYTRHMNLPSGVFFCYRVSAVNSAGTKTSPVRCAVPALPTQPTNLVLEKVRDTYAVFLSDPGVVWGWTYRVYVRRSAPLGLWKILREHRDQVDEETGLPLYFVGGLVPSTDYCAKVTRVNPLGESASSNVVCFKTPIPHPPAPTDFRVVNVTDSSITLRFTDIASNEEGTELLAQTGGPPWVLKSWGPLSGVVTYAHTGLQPDTTYFYYLRTYNAGGERFTEAILVDTDP